MAKKIFIVDDDQDIVESTKIVLEASGYEVEAAYSLDGGRSLISSSIPDLLLLDVMFPDQQDAGFEFCRELRTDDKTKNIPIIMYTAVNRDFPFHFKTDDEFLPANEFLNKPVDPKVLLEKVSSLI